MSEQSSTLYEEIDLRPYIEALIGNWYWLLAAAIVAGIGAFVVASLASPTYEATSIVTVTEPRFDISFDPRIETTERIQANMAAYPDLAMSDAVLQELYLSINTWPESIGSMENLRNHISAETGAGNNLLRLAVILEDPVLAAKVANTWAEVFIDTANLLYGLQGETPFSFLEAQLELADQELARAEEALIAFQAGNEAAILENELQAFTSAQGDHLNNQQVIGDALRNTRLFQEQLRSLPQGAKVPPSTQLALFILQSQAYGLDDSNLDLQLTGTENLFDLSPAEQEIALSLLAASLETKVRELELEIEELSPEILDTQQQLEEVSLEAARLELERSLALDTYATLARTVEEARIAAQDDNTQIKLASEAEVPTNEVGSSRILATVVAAALAFVLVALFIILATWWKSFSSTRNKGQPGD